MHGVEATHHVDRREARCFGLDHFVGRNIKEPSFPQSARRTSLSTSATSTEISPERALPKNAAVTSTRASDVQIGTLTRARTASWCDSLEYNFTIADESKYAAVTRGRPTRRRTAPCPPPPPSSLLQQHRKPVVGPNRAALPVVAHPGPSDEAFLSMTRPSPHSTPGRALRAVDPSRTGSARFPFRERDPSPAELAHRRP